MPEQLAQELAQQLTHRLGDLAVIQDPEELAFYSTDVYSAGPVAALAIRPQERGHLADAIRSITEAGFSITARGGGMSYTGGYVPNRNNTVVIDLSALNRIIEINEEDLVITAEAGVTWRQIYEALKPLGLRLPFFGTFSGARATVGGGLSNGALFMGTARHGTAAEIVVGMEIIDANGRLIRTGQSAFRNGRPAFRTYGPDLTGLFTHDAGALGVKTLASFRMMTAPSHEDYLSFAFGDQASCIRALSDIARSGATEEAYVFDPATTARSLEPASLKRDLERLGQVIRNRGLAEGARMALAGRRFAGDSVHTLHAVCAGRSAASVSSDIDQVLSIAERHGGGKIANTIPKAARANPFEPVNGILGADGERWAALNAKVPHSDAAQLIAKTEALIRAHQSDMDRLGVSLSFLFIAIQAHVFSYEPVLRWKDEWLPVHRRTPDPEHLATLTEPPANPEANALVAEIRSAIVALFAEFGAASNQIGKTYAHLASLNPESRSVLAALKHELDPHGLMNPGSLGAFQDSGDGT